MKILRVLFAEDDNPQAGEFGRAVEEWNGKQVGRRLEVVRVATVEEAAEQLSHMRLDAAIFDLRLPSRAGEKPAAKGGNNLAHLSIKEVGIPIGIISGNPADLDPELTKIHLVEAFNKGDEDVYPKVVAWLGDRWMMMTVLTSARREIRSIGAEIFVQRLWPRWQTYEGLTGASESELTQIVTRQYVGHIAESLGLDGGGNAPWHPYECFIQPALLEGRAQTGDLFRIDDRLWVVLTPACDMATKKLETVLLARIDEEVQPDWKVNIELLNKQELSNTQRDRRDKYFQKLLTQNVSPSDHFLPPLDQGPPMTVRFGEVSTRQLEWLNSNLQLRIASVAPAFLPNLVQRFGAWISRTGQPNIDFRHFR